MADEQQVQLLHLCVDRWNLWRSEHPRVRPDLSEAVLPNNLAGANLSFAELTGAVLPGGNFVGADLSYADLSDSDDLDTQLDGAIFDDANLYRAYLPFVDLPGASFRNAKLAEVNLSDCLLDGADFSGADLGFANLYGAFLRGANLSQAELIATVLADADLSNAAGLEAVLHRGPSVIDLDTFCYTDPPLPMRFLRGVGVPQDFATYATTTCDEVAQYHSCFISYSHTDREFARRLYDDLQSNGISCWLDEHEVLPGDDLHERVSRGIRQRDKLVLCCSEAALTSWWVNSEINKGLAKEVKLSKEEGHPVRALIPLDLDGHLFKWEDGKVDELTSRAAAAFVGWETDDDLYARALQSLIAALRTDRD